MKIDISLSCMIINYVGVLQWFHTLFNLHISSRPNINTTKTDELDLALVFILNNRQLTL